MVVSEYASGNLDRSLPFIEIIPNDKLHDLDYVSESIRRNQEISNRMRLEIRKYGLANFDWTKLVKEYAETISKWGE